jgi:hypothetical protein
MFWTIALVVIVWWLVSLAVSCLIGHFIHLLRMDDWSNSNTDSSAAARAGSYSADRRYRRRDSGLI